MTEKRDDTVRRMLGLFSARRGMVALAALLTVAVVVGTLSLPVLSGRAVDCVVGPGRVDFAGLRVTLSIIALALVLTAGCQWALTAVTNRLAFCASLELRCRAFDHLQELPLSYLDAHGHGDLASRIVTDADMLTNGLLMAFQQLPVGVLTIVVTLVFMFALNPAIAAVVALLTPVSIFTARFIATHSAKHFSGQRRACAASSPPTSRRWWGASPPSRPSRCRRACTRALPRRTPPLGRRASRRSSSPRW